MSSADVVEVAAIPKLSREQCAEIARRESDRFAALLACLSGDDWVQPTDCTRWTVREIALHQLSVAECWASLREFLSMYLRGLPITLRMRGLPVDGANEIGIADRRHLSDAELLARFERSRERLLRLRAAAPPALRAIPLPTGPTGWVSVGELYDIVLTRDTWTHRMDICRATRRRFPVESRLDGVLVADMVRDWAVRHRQPFTLHLTGPMSASYRSGTGGPTIAFDTLEFVRAVSGRRQESGLLGVHILF